MKIQCPNCTSRFKFNEAHLKPEGTKVRCTNCSTVFRIFPEDQYANSLTPPSGTQLNDEFLPPPPSEDFPTQSNAGPDGLFPPPGGPDGGYDAFQGQESDDTFGSFEAGQGFSDTFDSGDNLSGSGGFDTFDPASSSSNDSFMGDSSFDSPSMSDGGYDQNTIGGADHQMIDLEGQFGSDDETGLDTGPGGLNDNDGFDIDEPTPPPSSGGSDLSTNFAFEARQDLTAATKDLRAIEPGYLEQLMEKETEEKKEAEAPEQTGDIVKDDDSQKTVWNPKAKHVEIPHAYRMLVEVEVEQERRDSLEMTIEEFRKQQSGGVANPVRMKLKQFTGKRISGAKNPKRSLTVVMAFKAMFLGLAAFGAVSGFMMIVHGEYLLIPSYTPVGLIKALLGM